VLGGETDKSRRSTVPAKHKNNGPLEKLIFKLQIFLLWMTSQATLLKRQTIHPQQSPLSTHPQKKHLLFFGHNCSVPARLKESLLFKILFVVNLPLVVLI
jgi:hypothetical protein